MPLPQRVVMFISVVGPLLGLLLGIYMLWGRYWIGIGWPQIPPSADTPRF